MTVSERTALQLVVLWFSHVAAAQAPPVPPPTPTPAAPAPTPLTLATVLARGNELQMALPRTLWLPGGHSAVVVRQSADGRETMHRVADGKVADEVLVDAAALLAAIGEKVEGPARFPDVQWCDDKTLRIAAGPRLYRWQPGQPKAELTLEWTEPDLDGEPLQAIAPGDARVAWVHKHQVWLAEPGGKLRQLTFDGSQDIVYGNAAHRAEFGITRGLFWSKDGRFLCMSREDQRNIAAYPYQDLTRIPPVHVHGRYPMAGSTHASVTLLVCDTADYGVHVLQNDPAEDVYWTNVTFANDNTLVTARVNRGQDQLELVRYDAASGRKLATLLREHDPEWVEPEHGPTFLPDGRFLWWSPRSGHRHLWLHGPDGAEQAQVTKGAFDVQKLLGVSADAKTVWFQASGEDPRQLHLFAAKIDGTEVSQVTRERGTHRAELSPDGQWAHVVWSNVETRPSARLLDLANNTSIALPQGPDPLAPFALPTQRQFQIKAEDDTVLYGHVALPPGLADGQKCPVLLYVYGGPHVQLVTDQWFGGAPLWLQAFAAEGYVVCWLDNRGTPNRGIAFEQVLHRRLGVLEVQDQLRAVEWLQQQPFVDGARIGVHGWSYGGYLTLRLMLAAPTTFACGISGAPVTDWAMYETGYTERYMDSPSENAAGYRGSSCLPLVERLERPLLLVHGTDDRTVMWVHTLAFVDRCIEAGKQIDYFPYPTQQHGLRGKDRAHFLQRMHGFLARQLRSADKPEK
ncbi:MAG TPA: DPP IV N-terminal domain-containing protein [Planctomycetota bacterium]